MFEQTFLNQPADHRKPYSMVLSMALQILVIGALCLAPIIFTQMLPGIRWKTVLAAPPKPPLAVKAIATNSHAASVMPRTFRIAPLLLQAKPIKAFVASTPVAAPDIDVASNAGGDPNGVAGSLIGLTPMNAPPPPTPQPRQKAQPQKPMRVGTISAANLIHMVQPAYPPLARSSRVQGTVEFTATISKEGVIENLTLLKGHPLLIDAAKEAVLQWRYRPTLLNGQPVEVITDIVVNFTLNQ